MTAYHSFYHRRLNTDSLQPPVSASPLAAQCPLLYAVSVRQLDDEAALAAELGVALDEMVGCAHGGLVEGRGGGGNGGQGKEGGEGWEGEGGEGEGTGGGGIEGEEKEERK